MRLRAALVSMSLLAAPAAARAAATSDWPASLLVYPYVTVDVAQGIDTRIQLTNTSGDPVDAQCFYEQSVTDCVGGEAGRSCAFDAELPCLGECVTTPTRTFFFVRLTAGQPVAWPASTGLDPFPIDGVTRVGPNGQSNGASSVPPLGTGPITTVLRCVVVGPDPERPAAADVLVGQATIRRARVFPTPDSSAAQYRALGFRAMPEALNEGALLQLGGPNAEYEGCSDFHLLENFYSRAPLVTGKRTALVETTLVLTPCASAPVPISGSVATFDVYNEFAQRLSTARSLTGQVVLPIDRIDTASPTRSIFAVEVGGTLAAQTQIGSIGGGLHVLAIEIHRDQASSALRSAGLEAYGLGERAQGDALILRLPSCDGDCNLDGRVRLDEVIAGVGIGIGRLPVERCAAADTDDNGRVAIDEMISSVASSVDGCPQAEPTPSGPTATPSPTASPTTARPGVGPEITHFGLARADDVPLEAEEVDEQGRPVYLRPFGQGFALIVEARRGVARRAIGRNTFSPAGSAPDLQLLASNPFGDGEATVCEDDGARGGIPAVPELEFALDDEATVAAMNDLGCRAYERLGATNMPFTRAVSGGGAGQEPFAFVEAVSEIQFAVPIARAWALPEGDTILAVRVRDIDGNHSDVRQLILRIGED